MRNLIPILICILTPSLLTSLALPARAEGDVSREPSQVETPVFRFHIPNEPRSLDPMMVQSTDASYFLNNVSRGLFSYSPSKGLVSEGADRCVFTTPLKLRCDLSASAKWSDGSTVVADDYVRAFRRLLSKESKSSAVELLKNLKGALASHSGKTSSQTLGVRARNAKQLEFEFDKADSDFLFKLTSSVLVPVKMETFPTRENSHQVVVNGPYKVSKWLPGRRISLEPNLFYMKGNPKRPPVQALIIDDDQTALHLYEQGELTFLRRLPTTEIPKSKSRPDFVQIPMARFDYLGFGTDLRNEAKLREALSYSLDFKELAKIYDALGIPGCPSLPEKLMLDEPCIRFDLARAKKAFAEVPEALRNKRMRFAFSKLGGDDIKKGAEWIQGQWKKHLGLTVDLEQTEQGVYLALLRHNPPPVFRKGVGLDRPTCLAALETFAEGGAENFVRYASASYQGLLSKLQTASTEGERKKLCSEGIKLLLSENRLIPLGRIHFTLLAKQSFKGWVLNEMNQLDLSQLEASSISR